jgi:two-component system sensor histidine kinase KdpD
VYGIVAGAVSVAVDVAARQRATAARREVEASLLAGATAEPVAEQSLNRLLGQVRSTFGMNAVALLERDGAAERTIAVVGTAPDTEPVISARAGDGLRLVAWGDRVFAEDRRTLLRMATAAARMVETRRLADEAAHAQDLAEMDRVRAALLTAVGHDLRTPLAGIKAATATLRQPDLELSQQDRSDLLQGVEESTDRLDALVENLLSMSRLQAGVLSVHRRSVALDGVVAEALLHARARNAKVDVPDDLPPGCADPGLLERVVANLVANAAAASPPGRPIEVRGRATGDRVLIEVIDHGPGVPEADRERIFEPFQRLHDRTNTAGLGLGLAIARGLTAAMGGFLTPCETPGGGLTMVIDLPIAAP